MSEQWLADHKGAYKDTIGTVWCCGDYDCDCTQAQVKERYWNKVAGRPWVVIIGVWEGPFRSRDGDYEPEGSAEQDLVAYRDSLTPGAAARITWALPDAPLPSGVTE